MEEDLTILEEFKKNGYSMLYMKYGDRNTANLKLERALENLITRYKQLEEENRELREEECCMTTCLRKDKERVFFENKVKEKMEELDKRIKSVTTEDEYKNLKIYTCKDFNEFITSVLQELLDS